jgi:Ulp1 family protease
MRHYRDKEMLVIPFNMGNHWVALSISTKYDQVWYYDSLRPANPITGDRLTRDWTDVIAILNE